MPKRPPVKPKKTQHSKFVELARQLGADENEEAFVGKLRRIVAAPKPKSSKKKGS